ncbi:MAG: hypothetical protein HY342_05370 [Candidatus Lambdaproteobacteria bacterium]|nr:hypothetical protein [Candidatus Lambdaproteobacteria bacterium]
MATWIRFLHETGDSTLINASQVLLQFHVEQRQVEVFALGAPETLKHPVCVYTCEYPEQVTAAEELIMQALGNDQPVTISLDILDEQAEYLNHVNGMRMVLQLLHQGKVRIPVENDLSEDDLFERDPDERQSELSHFEEMLHTYLNVPEDALRRAYRKEGDDVPFELSQDHEECADHGFHEYWVVSARPDRNYKIRDSYDELAKSLIEKEGYGMASERGAHAHPSPQRPS